MRDKRALELSLLTVNARAEDRENRNNYLAALRRLVLSSRAAGESQPKLAGLMQTVSQGFEEALRVIERFAGLLGKASREEPAYVGLRPWDSISRKRRSQALPPRARSPRDLSENLPAVARSHTTSTTP